MRGWLGVLSLSVVGKGADEIDFAKFDLNGDGLIDPQEIRTVYKGKLSEEDMLDFWSAVDPTGTGAFTKAQYVDYAIRLQHSE
jgi:hypothetical protein